MNEVLKDVRWAARSHTLSAVVILAFAVSPSRTEILSGSLRELRELLEIDMNNFKMFACALAHFRNGGADETIVSVQRTHLPRGARRRVKWEGESS